jgi:general L-amino acid transport system permease protein
MGDDFGFIAEHLGDLLIGFPGHRPGGLLLSVVLSTAAIMLGGLLACALAPGLDASRSAIRWLTGAVVAGGRGVPLILLLLIVHQVLGARPLGVSFGSGSLLAALVALTWYSAAYQADVLRGGLRAVPTPLMDDARLLGSSPTRALVSVGLPYAVGVTRPALVNQAVTVFKDSSVVVILGVADLTTTARLVLGSDVANAPRWLATYLTVGALYFITALALSATARRHDWRLQRTALTATLGIDGG